MNRKVSFLTVVAVALAALAGAAIAAPDALNALFAALTDPYAVGAVLAFSPAVLKLQREQAARSSS
jgi:enterochelin esterase-like enzyme